MSYIFVDWRIHLQFISIRWEVVVNAHYMNEETEACWVSQPVCTRAQLGGQVVVSPACILPVTEEPARGHREQLQLTPMDSYRQEGYKRCGNPEKEKLLALTAVPGSGQERQGVWTQSFCP